MFSVPKDSFVFTPYGYLISPLYLCKDARNDKSSLRVGSILHLPVFQTSWFKKTGKNVVAAVKDVNVEFMKVCPAGDTMWQDRTALMKEFVEAARK